MLINVMYAITVPSFKDANNIENNENIIKILNLFKKYEIKYHTCDTIAGWFNLNHEWIETQTPIEAETRWNSVLPINWSNEDNELFKTLIYTGKIIVKVWYIKEDENGINYELHH